jgi:ankyrin repeat protein
MINSDPKDKYIDYAKLLLSNSTDIKCYRGVHRSPLQTAVWFKNPKMVQFLLDKGTEINAKRGRSRTTLNAAIFARREDIAKALLDKGANGNIEFEGRTALDFAIKNRLISIMHLLLQNRIDPNEPPNVSETLLFE